MKPFLTSLLEFIVSSCGSTKDFNLRPANLGYDDGIAAVLHRLLKMQKVNRCLNYLVNIRACYRVRLVSLSCLERLPWSKEDNLSHKIARNETSKERFGD